MKKKVLVVEDRALTAEDIRQVLEAAGYEVVGPVRSAGEALAKLAKVTDVNLALLDINLGNDEVEDGIDLAEAILEIREMPIVFLTAFTGDYIERAKKTYPAAYLLKPFNERDLQIAIDMAIHNFEREKEAVELSVLEDRIFIKVVREEEKFIRLNKEDILWIKADGTYIDIYTLEGTPHRLAKSLKAFDNAVGRKLPFLMRVHRSYMVNTEYIVGFGNDYVDLAWKAENGEKKTERISVSRDNRAKVRQHFLNI